MIPRSTHRYPKIFSSLHPLVQNNTLEIVSHFSQIHSVVLELNGNFLSDDVIQIAITDKIIFQILLGANDFVIDLCDITQIE